jgi:glycerophosphoryl diester phosphodiesterase
MPKSPLIIGHRGASAHTPENTIAAFEQALRYHADGIELDAKLSKDGHVIVIHDKTVDRTTDGVGEVKELTLAEIRTLDAGCKYEKRFQNERIPLLEEVFESVGNKMLINIELTNYANPSDQLPEKVSELVNKHGMQKSIIFSSFLPRTLLRIRKLLPTIPAGILALPGLAGTLSRSFIGKWITPDLVHPYFTDVDSAFVQREHRWNRKVNVWTVDKEKEILKMLAFDVDGIITDDVPLVLKLRNEHEKGNKG